MKNRREAVGNEVKKQQWGAEKEEVIGCSSPPAFPQLQGKLSSKLCWPHLIKASQGYVLL